MWPLAGRPENRNVDVAKKGEIQQEDGKMGLEWGSSSSVQLVRILKDTLLVGKQLSPELPTDPPSSL